MEKEKKERREVLKKAWVVPTFLVLGTMIAPAAPGGSNIPMDVCTRNPHIRGCS